MKNDTTKAAMNEAMIEEQHPTSKKPHSPKQVASLRVFVKSTPDLERQVSKITTSTLTFLNIGKITTNFLKILRDKKEEMSIKEFSQSLKRFS